MLKIKYYSTNVGVIFKIAHSYVYDLNSYCTYIDDTYVDNIQELNNRWYKIDNIPFSIKKKVPTKKTLVGYELKSTSLASDNIPAFLTLEQLTPVEDDDDIYGYSGEYKEFAYLYKPKFDDIPEQLEEVPFELIDLGEIEVENYNSPEKIIIKQKHERTDGKPTNVDLSSIVRYEELHEILTPEFLVHNCPCTLSSEQMFKIIRYYVKENINPSEARITSDYDFCFTVKKVIKKEPSAVTKYKKSTEDLFEVFEMTWSGYGGKSTGYQGYTPIQALNASSLGDMKVKLEEYLTKLMDIINSEVEQCDCCKGTGHVVNKIETNFKL